jgi:HEPN domain-containing protein
MKSSAGWYSNYYQIETSALGESVTRKVTFDIQQIIENEIEELKVDESPKEPSVHGTTIRMKALHQSVPTGTALSKLRDYLSSIYREVLRTGDVEIHIADKKLEYTDPPILRAPFRDAKAKSNNESDGPISEAIYWRKNFEFDLSESHEMDSAPDRPENAPRISGWVGIAEEGRSLGLALIWRKKVVSGAGAAARGDDDSYRPRAVFGNPGTFTFQRLLGECDMSELEVTAYKDSINWRPGQEEEFLRKLAGVFEAKDPHSFKAMATNYRSTETSEEIESKVQVAVEQAAQAATKALAQALKEETIEVSDLRDLFQAITSEQKHEGRALLYRDSSEHRSYFLEVVTDSTVNELVRTIEENGNNIISINRSHPFMESFANLPGADLDPALRLCVAIALAQIKVQKLGLSGWYLFVDYINDYLGDRLSERLG